MGARGLQQRVGAGDVGAHEGGGVVYGAVHVRLGGEVHDGVGAVGGEDLAHRPGVGLHLCPALRGHVQPADQVGHAARPRLEAVGIGARQPQHPHHHILNLFLGRLTLPDHGLFDLQGGVFVYRQAAHHQGRHRRCSQPSRTYRSPR